MASTEADFSQIFLTYADVIEANPDWTVKMVEDYMASKRDLADVADLTDETIQNILDNTQQISGNSSDIGRLRAVNNKQQSQISTLLELVEDSQQVISGLTVDDGRLRARVNELAFKVNNLGVYSFNKLIGATTQAVTSTLTAITWDSSTDSSGSDVTFSGGNPTRLTAVSTGIYKVSGYIAASSAAQRAQFAAEILINGTATGLQRGGTYIRNSGTSYDFWTLEVASTPFSLTAADYVELAVGQVTGAAYGYSGALTITCDRTKSEFWLERVS